MTHKTHLLAILLMSCLLGRPALAQEEEEAQEEEWSGDALAGEPQKTLAERIPSVTRRMFLKGGRFELVPAVSYSLNDPFFRHLMISGGASYHIAEWLWVRLGGEFYGSMKTSILVSGGGTTTAPDYNRPKFGAGLDVGFSPLYGKFSLAAESVVHFDTYVALGGALVAPKSGNTSFGGTVALGQHFFFNEWLALRLEARDQVFSMARAPAVNDDKVIQNLFSFSLGVAFFVPPTFEHEAL